MTIRARAPAKDVGSAFRPTLIAYFHTFDTDRLAPGILHIAITPKRDDA
jgi:hypothetical protein